MSREALIERGTQAATYGGAGSAVVGGMSANEIAAWGGLAVAILGLVLNLAVTIYFKQRHLNVVAEAAKARPDCATCPEKEA